MQASDSCQISRARILDGKPEWDPETGFLLSPVYPNTEKIRSRWRVSMEVRVSTGEATKIICASPAFKDEIIHRRTSDR